MSDDQSEGDVGDVVDPEATVSEAIDQTLGFLERMRGVVSAQSQALEDDNSLSSALERDITHLGKLFGILAAQEERLNGLKDKRSGAAGGYAIDVDAARSEIGRRLSLLRDARGSGEVSAGTE